MTRRRRPPGFTLIEMLVVIIIIGILASFVAVGVNHAINSAKASTTEGMIKALSGACGTYFTQWGDYPPTDLQELGCSGINDINNGAEALVGCLSSKKGGGIKYTADEGLLENIDGDKSDSAAKVLDWYFGDGQLREYMDAFGYPISYYHHKDYGRNNPRLVKYKLLRTADNVEIKPFKSPATSTFVGPASFQIRSVGKDGKPGTEDDIVVGR